MAMTRRRLESGRVGNGLFVCAANDEHAATLADAILTTSRSPSGHIDVDSSDKTVSCPPVSFVETEYLQQISRLLKPDGVLAITRIRAGSRHVTARCQRYKTVFRNSVLSHACRCDDEDRQDVNVVLFVPEPSELPSKSKLVERWKSSYRRNVLTELSFRPEESLDETVNIDADASNSSTKNASGKKKPKKNKKTRQTKVKNFQLDACYR
jgi:hypothetical protein